MLNIMTLVVSKGFRKLRSGEEILIFQICGLVVQLQHPVTLIPVAEAIWSASWKAPYLKYKHFLCNWMNILLCLTYSGLIALLFSQSYFYPSLPPKSSGDTAFPSPTFYFHNCARWVNQKEWLTQVHPVGFSMVSSVLNAFTWIAQDRPVFSDLRS